MGVVPPSVVTHVPVASAHDPVPKAALRYLFAHHAGVQANTKRIERRIFLITKASTNK